MGSSHGLKLVSPTRPRVSGGDSAIHGLIELADIAEQCRAYVSRCQQGARGVGVTSKRRLNISQWGDHPADSASNSVDEALSASSHSKRRVIALSLLVLRASS